ncbi:hypothetical protein [Nocardia sp. NPDC059239]|uniref:hypothetical protein n=1 Tax=unclassified Nocardia TaxID=2637762 RepID=UPI00368AB542
MNEAAHRSSGEPEPPADTAQAFALGKQCVNIVVAFSGSHCRPVGALLRRWWGHRSNRARIIVTGLFATIGVDTDRSGSDFLYCGFGSCLEDREQDHAAHGHAGQVSGERQHGVCLGSPAFLDEIDERRRQCRVLWCRLVEYGAQRIPE